MISRAGHVYHEKSLEPGGIALGRFFINYKSYG